MPSVNKTILIGNVTRDVAIRFLESGNAVANIGIATNEKWTDKQGNKQEKAEFHNLTAWGKTAELMAEYVKKGALLYIEGKLTTEQYEKNGEKRYATKIVINNFQMLDGKARSEGGHTESAPTSGADDDQDVPF